MADIVNFPPEKQAAAMNRLASNFTPLDLQDEALFKLEFLLVNAVDVLKLPPQVLETVMLSRPITGLRPVDADGLLDLVQSKVAEVRYKLAEYRMTKQKLLTEER